MVYANQGPQPIGRGSMGGSYSPPVQLTPQQQAQAERDGAIAHEKARRRAADKARGIMHPSDPETVVHWVSRPQEHRMSRTEQERRVKDGSLPPVYGRLLARVDHMKAYPDDPYGPLRVEPLTGPMTQEMQVKQAEPIQVASARVQGHGVVPQSPQQQLHHQFETTVAARAQGLLKANKDRLNGEQTAYLQDNNPKSDRWSHLWAVAGQRREFQAQHADLQRQLELTVGEMSNLSDIPDGMGLMSTPQARQNSPKHQKLLGLSEQKRRLEARIEVVKQMQVSLAYAYPALSAVKNELGTNAGDMQAVQGRLPQAFDGIRGDIDKLSGEIRKDPSTALLFDSVVTGALRGGGHDARQMQELSGWLEGERGNKERLSALGQALGGGLFLASFVPQLRGLSPLLKVLGAGTLGATFAYDLPDLMLLDAAAQSGRGGAGQLTGQSPEEARFNLVMGYANVALAGLDVGAEVGVIRGLERLVGRGALMGVRVSRQIWTQVLSLSKQGAVGMEKAKALLMQVRGVPQGMVDEVLEVLSPSQEMVGVGKVSRSEMRGTTAEVTTQEAVKKAKAGAKGRKPPKGFDEYLNAATVKPFIGTKVDPNHLPEGYLYGKIPMGKDKAGNEVYREVVYMAGSDKTRVPLKVEKGTIQMGKEGEYRVVDGGVYPKNVETIAGKPGKLLGGDSQVHHMFADNMLRSTPFGQRALRLGAVNPDGSMNLIELANSTENLAKGRAAFPDVQFSDFIHNTQHPKFDGLMQEVVDDVIKEVREAKGLSGIKEEDFIQQMTKEEIETVWNRSAKRMRRGLMNEDEELYMEIEKRTRPGKNSLAQSENPDGSEVA